MLDRIQLDGLGVHLITQEEQNPISPDVQYLRWCGELQGGERMEVRVQDLPFSHVGVECVGGTQPDSAGVVQVHLFKGGQRFPMRLPTGHLGPGADETPQDVRREILRELPLVHAVLVGVLGLHARQHPPS